jgi:hypothetical protein
MFVAFNFLRQFTSFILLKIKVMKKLNIILFNVINHIIFDFFITLIFNKINDAN